MAAAVPDLLVRPALQLALAVAAEGITAEPAVEPPRALRPFLRFNRLPDHALAAVRRSLENDDGFRVRVAEAAEEAAIGRASWLFLSRPEGWDAELQELAARAGAAADAARDARDERVAGKRVEQARAAAERAAREAAAAGADAATAVTALHDERRARRAAEQEGLTSLARIADLEQALSTARRRVEEMAAELARAEATISELGKGPAQAPPVRPAPPPFETGGIHRALDAAGAALGAVRRALARAEADASAGPVPAGPPEAPRGDGPAPSTGGPAWSGPPGAAPRRRPAPLPPAVFEDSTEAAAHLVRVQGALLLVDGYNAAMSIWPGLAVGEMRGRLIDALAELSARTGAEAHVVFDGAELAGSVARPGGRAPVRVTFSPPEVEADDVILELVGRLPAARPVIVASDDRRVRDGARAGGANVITCAQLSAVLGR